MTGPKDDTDKGAENREHDCCRALPVTNGDVQTGASKGGSEAETVHPVGKGQERESSDRKIQHCED